MFPSTPASSRKQIGSIFKRAWGAASCRCSNSMFQQMFQYFSMSKIIYLANVMYSCMSEAITFHDAYSVIYSVPSVNSFIERLKRIANLHRMNIHDFRKILQLLSDETCKISIEIASPHQMHYHRCHGIYQLFSSRATFRISAISFIRFFLRQWGFS